MDRAELYEERLERIERAIRLEPVDRIPVIYIGLAFSPRYMGMPISQFCTDDEAAADVTLTAVERLGGIDGLNGVPVGRIHIGLTATWLSHVSIPGRELPDDSLWQVDEREVMSVEDYDLVINNGWQTFLDQHLPKVVDMEEFEQALSWADTNTARILQRFRDHGYVNLSGADTSIPFEYFCGARSMSQFFLDLYRRPEKVKEAMDVILPDLIQAAIDTTKASGAMGCWVGGWRTASALVAPKIWDELVFPYYLEMVNALADNDIISILHFDQDWTRDLARLRELPARMCLLNLDGTTDVRKAKEVLHDHMAILGDVPSSLFAAGTPDDMYTYVHDLVRDVGPTGLLLCPGCDAPINTKPENMEAFLTAGREFGTVAA